MSVSLQIGIVFLLNYVALVRFLRWRRYNALHAKYANRPLSSISPQEAQEIMHLADMWDMPSLNIYALSFAMFKTYAIVRDTILSSSPSLINLI